MKDCSGLRLLIVGPYPPPFGGIASHLTTLIPGLRARGAADIAVISFGDKDAVEQIDGATLYRFEARRHARDLLAPRHWRAVLATCRSLGCSGLGLRNLVAEMTRAALVLEVAERHGSQVASFYHTNVSLSLLPCTSLWGDRSGSVLTVFGECYDTPEFFAQHPQIVRRLLDTPHAVVSSSKHCARSFAKVGVERPIEAVYYGIDLERFAAPQLRAPWRAGLGVADDEILITYMGRFLEVMGLGRVLEVGDRLLERLPRVKLLLAGARGTLDAQAREFAARHPGRVHIRHDVPFALQPSIYAGSDILLAPSADQHACMGMSIKEAMAASLPVIGSDSGGIPEAIIDGECGVLVPLDASRQVDPEVLLATIERLAGDAGLRARLGGAARRRAEDLFAMDRTIDRMAEIFLAARPR